MGVPSSQCACSGKAPTTLVHCSGWRRFLSGVSPDEALVEIVELADHPWFIGCQFHPEFKSRPVDCHPLFKGFIRAALQHKAEVGQTPLLSAVRAVH